jgi:TM2 domain-containing membrane protein YozV
MHKKAEERVWQAIAVLVFALFLFLTIPGLLRFAESHVLKILAIVSALIGLGVWRIITLADKSKDYKDEVASLHDKRMDILRHGEAHLIR